MLAFQNMQMLIESHSIVEKKITVILFVPSLLFLLFILLTSIQLTSWGP